MVCKQCGAYCEQGRSFCPVCQAPLSAEEYSEAEALTEHTPQDANQAGKWSSWGFVPSPNWPKPKFDINTVEEEPQPAPLSPENARQRPGQYTPPAADKDSGRQGGRFAPQPYYGGGSAPGHGPVQDKPYSAKGEYDAPPAQTGEEGFGLEDAPEPDYATPPYDGIKPVASVGSYEYGYNTGSFGRLPRREDYSSREDGEYMGAKSRGGIGAGLNSRRPRATRPGRPYKSGINNSLLFFGAVGLLVVLLVVFGIIAVNRNFGGFSGLFSSVFGGSPILKDPEMGEGVNDKGVEVWEVIVYAREGTEVVVSAGGTPQSGIIGSKNRLVLQIPKNMLKPAEPVEGTTAQVAPEITLKTKDGEEIPLEIPPFTVDVPALSLEVVNPESSAVTVGRSKVSFTGKVNDGNVAVTVNGQPLTVAADGSFTGDYELPGVGSHAVTLEAKKNGYQIARSAYQIEYSATATNIDVDKRTLRAPGEGDTATVQGNVEPGSTVAVSSGSAKVTLGEPNVNAQTGIFSFTVKMEEIGYYTIDVTVLKDGNSKTGSVVTERAPNYQSYTASVHKQDYNRMTKEPQHAGKYKCVGKVLEVIQEEPFVIAKLQTGDGDLIFEYHNVTASVSADDGRTYNLYGDYIGIDEESGLPRLYTWFITKEN